MGLIHTCICKSCLECSGCSNTLSSGPLRVSQRVLGYDPTYGRFAFLGPAHGYDHTYGVFAFLRSVTSKRLFKLLWLTLLWILQWLELLNLYCLSNLYCGGRPYIVGHIPARSVASNLHLNILREGYSLARLKEKAAIPSLRYMAGPTRSL